MPRSLVGWDMVAGPPWLRGKSRGSERRREPFSRRPPCRYESGLALQVAAERLFALQGHEQRLEVPLPEAAGAVPLDQLEEHRRPVLRHLGEDLQQVALIVAVGQHAQLLQAPQVEVEVGEPLRQVAVVGVRHPHELDPAGPQRPDALDDVAGLDGDVLDPRAAVELEVLVDLGSSSALDPLVEADPVVHPAQLDVADHVVDGLKARGRQRVGRRRPGDVAGQERPLVGGAVDQRVDGVAVGGDRGPADDAVVVLVVGRLGRPAGAALHRRPVGDHGVRHGEGDVVDPVAVPGDVGGDLRVGAQRGGEHEPDGSLFQHPGGPVAHARLRAGVGDRGEPEPGPVEVGRLPGVAHPQLDVVDAEQSERVVRVGRGHAPPPARRPRAGPEIRKGGLGCPHGPRGYLVDAAYARTSSEVRSARGRRSSKRAPAPGLTGSPTSSSPPWAWASWRAMYNPSPTPPARRVAPESSWVNRSKMRSRSGRGTPGPASSTASTASAPARPASSRMGVPSGEYLAALSSRLPSTCNSAREAACTGSAPPTATSMRRSGWQTPAASPASRATSAASTRCRSTCSRPVCSKRAASRSCSIRSFRRVPWRTAMSTNSRRSAGSSAAPRVLSVPSVPRITVSGVFSSWETVASRSRLSRSLSWSRRMRACSPSTSRACSAAIAVARSAAASASTRSRSARIAPRQVRYTAAVGRARIGTSSRLRSATTVTIGAIPSSIDEVHARTPTPWRASSQAGAPSAKMKTASTSALLTTKNVSAAAANAASPTGPRPRSPPSSSYTPPAAPRESASWAELNRILRAALPPSRSARAEQSPSATTPAATPQPSTSANANGWDMVVASRDRPTGAPPGGSPDPSDRSTGAPPRGSPDPSGRPGEVVVGAADAGRRLDEVAAEAAGVSRARAARWAGEGLVLVDGRARPKSHRLLGGERLAWTPPPLPSGGGRPAAEDLPVEVRYEDDRLLVVAKPAGLVVHPGPG